jgi:proline iminopeptidase
VTYGNPSGERILVLHGGPGAQHDYLLPQLLAMAAKYQLIFYDQRGGGQSRDDSRNPITWRTHVQDLAAVVEEFGLRPLTLFGYSWGGLLALVYALEHGGSAPAPSRLILVSPAPATSSHRAEMELVFGSRQNAEPLRKAREELSGSGLRESDPEQYRKRLFELSVAGYFHDPRRARELTPFRVVGRVQESVWKSLGVYDLIPHLRTLAIPTFLAHGRDDPIPLQSSLEIADALVARLLLLEKCGHVPYVEQPLALFSAIEVFLDNYNV